MQVQPSRAADRGRGAAGPVFLPRPAAVAAGAHRAAAAACVSRAVVAAAAGARQLFGGPRCTMTVNACCIRIHTDVSAAAKEDSSGSIGVASGHMLCVCTRDGIAWIENTEAILQPILIRGGVLHGCHSATRERYGMLETCMNTHGWRIASGKAVQSDATQMRPRAPSVHPHT
eukprot:358012-Chlamydomonas_euryale.AAC.2